DGSIDALKIARLVAGWEHQAGRQIVKATLETPVAWTQSRISLDHINGEVLIDDASMKLKHFEIPLHGQLSVDWKQWYLRSRWEAALLGKAQRLNIEAVGNNKPFVRFSARSEGLDLSGFANMTGAGTPYPWSAKPWDEWLMKALSRVEAYGQVRIDALTT